MTIASYMAGVYEAPSDERLAHMDIRRAFIESAGVCLGLVNHSGIAKAWSQPSALKDWAVGGLTAHLTRAVVNVERYLDADPDPGGQPISSGEYYVRVLDTFDLDSDLHRDIRARGDEMAAAGYEHIMRLFEETIERLRDRLTDEPAERLVTVLQGLVMTLDDYLRTRIVELVLHADDVAVSVGEKTPEFPHQATAIAIDTLIGVGRFRHGDLAMLRALARKERDQSDASRIL
jgi:uncharacterized protein (TIGR03083 family)